MPWDITTPKKRLLPVPLGTKFLASQFIEGRKSCLSNLEDNTLQWGQSASSGILPTSLSQETASWYAAKGQGLKLVKNEALCEQHGSTSCSPQLTAESRFLAEVKERNYKWFRIKSFTRHHVCVLKTKPSDAVPRASGIRNEAVLHDGLADNHLYAGTPFWSICR